MRILLALASVLVVVFTAPAQTGGSTASCTQILKLAQTTYEQGRLHEVPNLLESCLKRQAFSAEENRDAYKLLTQTYIYLEEPEKADAHMILLLKADPFFEVDEAVDPAELIALYRKFRVKPLFRVGFKGGINVTSPAFTENFYVGANSKGVGTYTAYVGFQAMVTIERDLFQQNRFRNNWKQRLIAGAEIMYSARNFTYTNNRVFSSDADASAPAILPAQVRQVWFDFSPSLKYTLGKRAVYVTLGPVVSLRQSVESTPTTEITPNGATPSTLTGTVTQTDAFVPLLYSVQVGAGTKYRIGKFYVTIDLRYQHGLQNVINEGSRSTPEAIFDYGFQNNNFRQNNFTFNVGFLIPYFKPKKLIR